MLSRRRGEGGDLIGERAGLTGAGKGALSRRLGGLRDDGEGGRNSLPQLLERGGTASASSSSSDE